MDSLDKSILDYRRKLYTSLAGVQTDANLNAALAGVETKLCRTAEQMVLSEALEDKSLGVETLLHALAESKRDKLLNKPDHDPWELKRVMAGHMGWVRCLSVDKTNEWFASGADDSLIKIWDLASGDLKVSLTGHIGGVTAVKVSDRHPYLFSAGDDNQVKCWDLNMNRVVRHYHGHLNGVYCMDLHPSLDVLVTAGRDAVLRVWDIRTKAQVHVMEGHTDSVAELICQDHEPQIISGSYDKTLRLWDLAAGKVSQVLTHHKKAVRGLARHPDQHRFVSSAGDNVKLWKGYPSEFDKNTACVNDMVNCVGAVETSNGNTMIVGGTDTGSLHFWDWESGMLLNTVESPPQSGSLAAENAVFDLVFDRSETRLLTAGCDKTIKVYSQV